MSKMFEPVTTAAKESTLAMVMLVTALEGFKTTVQQAREAIEDFGNDGTKTIGD